MDFANRGNSPQSQPTAQKEPANVSGPQMGGSSFEPKKSSSKKGMNFGTIGRVLVLFGITVLIVALIFAVIFGNNSSSSTNIDDERARITTDKYQAIFLNSQDGQVYFGKLKIMNSDLYELTDIYYVRVSTPIQPEGSNQPPQQNISLAKLGKELHAPEDTMFIRRDQILYWENLKDDGQVVTAIKEYQKNGEQTPPAETPAAPQSNGTPAPAPAPAPEQEETPAPATP